MNTYLGHTKDESHYFLLLIQLARAGTNTLRKYFEEQVQHLAEKRFSFKDRLKFKQSLNREDQVIFYSSWYYGAIHVLVSIPGCHTDRGISEYLDLPLELVRNVLEFLESVHLVQKKDGKFQVGTTHIHLERESPMISKHHINWRLQAMQALERRKDDNLHYSSVITASFEDSFRIKEVLAKAIEEIRAIVKPSKDEAGYVYSIDFFGLKK